MRVADGFNEISESVTYGAYTRTDSSMNIVSVVKDPTSDMAACAKNGSALVASEEDAVKKLGEQMLCALTK